MEKTSTTREKRMPEKTKNKIKWMSIERITMKTELKSKSK
jgi:hypothetical protein